MRTISDPLTRLLAKVKVDETTGCWLWIGYRQPNGYGLFGVGSRTDGSRRRVFVHRWAYEHFKGPIPKGLMIDHLCRTRACANPDHLEAVTQATNLLRGDTVPAKNAAKTHCPSGHPYSGSNLYIRPNGNRVCRTCSRTTRLRSYHRDPARKARYQAAMRARARRLRTG